MRVLFLWKAFAFWGRKGKRSRFRFLELRRRRRFRLAELSRDSFELQLSAFKGSLP